MKLITYISLCFLLSGCAGFVYETYHINEIKIGSPILGKQVGTIFGTGEASYSKGAVLEAWGEPNKKIISASVEKWIYEKKEADKGFFVLLLILPIPVVYSDGMEAMSLNFIDDTLLNVELRYEYSKGGSCLVAIPSHPFPESGCKKATKGKLTDGIPSTFNSYSQI